MAAAPRSLPGGLHADLRRGLDRALSALEGASVDRLRLAPRTPPLFVIGPPRSGTTALYLSLVNAWRLAFLPNVSKRHPRAPFLYAVLTGLTARYRPTLRNEFGIVDQSLGPSDGWEVFQRWFPAGHGALRPGADPRELRTLVRLFERLQGGPFCVRNNVNSLRIPELAALFPDALFLVARRDWREVALSLVDAYEKHETPPGAWWSAGPPDYDPAELAPPLKKAVFQVLGVEAIMRRDLAALPPARHRTIAYDDLCRSPESVQETVRALYAARGVRLERRPAGPDAASPRRSTRWARLAEQSRPLLDAFAEEFLRGAHLRSERHLTPAVRGGVAA